MINAFSIDVEDYWSLFFRNWLNTPTGPSDSVVKNTEWFLETLADCDVKATFFVLGEVAQKFPSLVRKIADGGHEIASHGFSHKQVFKLSKEQFRLEVVDCKKLLENIISEPILGYRAPAFSIIPKTSWALEILAEEGFKYDSSVYPISGKRYGWPGFSRGICKVNLPSGRTIIEVPMSTVTILGKTLPTAGGGYLRHFPYAITKLAIKNIQKTRPAVVYMHPYEIDTEFGTLDTKHLTPKEKNKAINIHKMQLRNRHTTVRKLFKLISDFEFTTIGKVIEKTDNLPVWLVK